MQKHCYGTGEKKQQETAEHIGKPIARSLEGVIAMSREMEEKLARIKNCPEPCNDGMVEINVSSGQIRKMACPIIASGCPYGKRLEHELDRYITGVMSGIGVPKRHLENFTDVFHTEALVEIDKCPIRGFLIFTGGTGSGKSFGAARAVLKYLKSLVVDHFDRNTWRIAERAGSIGSVMWCAAMDLSDDRETAARAKREQLIVIDDLGGEADTPVIQAILRGVILKRHDMKLPTVITTTLTMLDIDIRYGGRVADRLIEDIGKGGMIIECGDVSIRNSAAFLATLATTGRQQP